MRRCNHREELALSVFDCNSTDVANLKSEIEHYWDNRLKFKRENRDFSRAYTFNQAVHQSDSDKVFICDADMNLPVDFVEQFNKYVGKTTVWFPICYSLFKGKKPEIAKGNGWWRGEGHGMVGILKQNFELLNGYSLNFKKWGGEDDDLFVRAHRHFRVIRRECIGLFHTWHPPDEKWGGRDVNEHISNHLEALAQFSKDIIVISRGIFLNYIADLIFSGKSDEARKILNRNFQYAHFSRWWKLWLGSWMPQWLLKYLSSRYER
jgi:glycosyltransferase involved in cell wall biosynthesis